MVEKGVFMVEKGVCYGGEGCGYGGEECVYGGEGGVVSGEGWGWRITKYVNELKSTFQIVYYIIHFRPS